MGRFQGIQAIKAYAFENANSLGFGKDSRSALDTAFALRRDFAVLKVSATYFLALVLFATDYVATRPAMRSSGCCTTRRPWRAFAMR